MKVAKESGSFIAFLRDRLPLKASSEFTKGLLTFEKVDTDDSPERVFLMFARNLAQFYDISGSIQVYTKRTFFLITGCRVITRPTGR